MTRLKKQCEPTSDVRIMSPRARAPQRWPRCFRNAKALPERRWPPSLPVETLIRTFLLASSRLTHRSARVGNSMKYLASLILVCLCLTATVATQSDADVYEYRVSGKVTFKKNQSPPGATVYVMGTR